MLEDITSSTVTEDGGLDGAAINFISFTMDIIDYV